MATSAESEFHAEIDDERASLVGHGFGVVFRKQSDRWTDAIVGPDPLTELAISQPESSTSPDPSRIVSPVYQELQLHGPETGPTLCLLLTGLSFDHHFSAAVTLSLDPAQRGSVLLDVDVADRCRSPVQSLAATYLVDLDSGSLMAAEPGTIVWQVAGASPGRLELVAEPPASLALAEAGRKAMRVQILATLQPETFTHRLRYRWRWTSALALTR